MLKTVLPTWGSKSGIASQIIAMLPPHDLYIEIFAGSLSVLLNKPLSKHEIVYDLSPEIINFWRIVKNSPNELAEAIWLTPYGAPIQALSDAHQAAAFCASQKMGYSGHTKKKFSLTLDTSQSTTSKAEVWANWFKRIAPASRRVSNVTMVLGDGLSALAKYGWNKDAVIYADPPYFGHEHEYQYGIGVEYTDFVKKMALCKARIIVSEREQALQFYKNWYVTETVNLRSRTKRAEFLLTNFPSIGTRI